MESLGEFLKNHRESKKLSLGALAGKTRIGEAYVRAIEADDWDRFPSVVIARGFVRSYGEALRLDAGELLQRFDDSVRPIYEEKESARQPYKDQVVRIRPQEPNRRAVGQILFILLAFIALGVLYIVGSKRFNEPAATPVPLEAETEALTGTGIPPEPVVMERDPFEGEMAVNPPAPVEEGPPKVLAPIPAVPPSVAEPREPVPPGPMILTMEAVDTSWVSIRIDDAPPREVLLRPGEKISWRANEKIVMDLGNAGGAVFQLNGKPLEPFGPPGAVIKNIVLTADALKGSPTEE